MPPEKKQPKPDEQCLVCKTSMHAKPGAVYNGKSSHGMIAKFWLCNECADKLSEKKGVKSA